MKKFIFLLLIFIAPHGAFALGTGWTDVTTAWTYSGWACDPAAPGYQTAVHIWRDDGKFLGGVGATMVREPAVGAACGSRHSSHGFHLNIEQKTELMDGKVHNVTLYVLDHAGNPAPIGTRSVQFPSSPNNVAAPRAPGDVVARDLAVPGIGALGHVGIWDGSSVIEMLNEGYGNKIFINSWGNFKSRSTPWHTAYPNFPRHTIKTCWGSTCDINSNRPDQLTFNAQEATFRRAFQVYLIGSDYTITRVYSTAEPAMVDYTDRRWTRPPRRGTYRCDTFIYDAFRATTDLDRSGIFPFRNVYNMTSSWRSKVAALYDYWEMTPARLMQKVREL